MHRRVFVKNSALALVTLGLSPTFLRRTAFGMSPPRAEKGKVLICLFQRGAADALNVVVPHGDPSYYRCDRASRLPRRRGRRAPPEPLTSMDSSACIRRSRP